MSLKRYKIDKHISVEVHHDIDGEAMAEMFWAMDEDEQVAFFNQLGDIFEHKTNIASVQKQMLAVAMNKNLNEDGIAAIVHIANINKFIEADDHG